MGLFKPSGRNLIYKSNHSSKPIKKWQGKRSPRWQCFAIFLICKFYICFFLTSFTVRYIIIGHFLIFRTVIVTKPTRKIKRNRQLYIYCTMNTQGYRKITIFLHQLKSVKNNRFQGQLWRLREMTPFFMRLNSWWYFIICWWTADDPKCWSFRIKFKQ